NIHFFQLHFPKLVESHNEKQLMEIHQYHQINFLKLVLSYSTFYSPFLGVKKRRSIYLNALQCFYSIVFPHPRSITTETVMWFFSTLFLVFSPSPINTNVRRSLSIKDFS